MKPLKLVMQAFGPYPGREEIDFCERARAGIFLIKGPTGSGKTTIFDAMSMALYGKSTSEEDKSKTGRNKLEEWRCNQANTKDETIVEFTFEAGGKIYRFSRKLIPKRVRLDQVNAVSCMDENDVFQAIEENPKDSVMNAKAEEIIGLNSNQFKQVVLLPQGKFEQFITASSSEKEQILSRLFDASQWERYAYVLFEKADARKKALSEEKNIIEISLSEEKEGFKTLDELNAYISTLENELEHIEQKHLLFQAETKKAALDEDKKLVEKYHRLHELEEVKIKLANKAEEISLLKAELEKADKAEKVREPICEVEKCLDNYENRKTDCEALGKKAPQLEDAQKEAKLAYEQHRMNKVVEECSQQIAKLEAKRSVYEQIDQLYQAAEDAKSVYHEAERIFRTQEKLLEKAKEAAENKLLRSNEAEQKARLYRNKYYAGIYGEIASSLEDNFPCPVCGSTSHPRPAKRSEEAVTKAVMEEAEQIAVNAKKDWQLSEENRVLADGKTREQERKLSDAKSKREQASALYTEASKNLIRGVNSTEELENEIKGIRLKIEQYKRKESALEEAYHAANAALIKHRERIEASQKEHEKAKLQYESAREGLLKKLEENGYDTMEDAKADQLSAKECIQKQKWLTEYDTKVKDNILYLDQQVKLLAGTKEPDSSLFAERQKEIDEEQKCYTKDQTQISGEIKRLKNKYLQLEKKNKHYLDNIHEAETDWAFAKSLRGDTGIGLMRYVLGIMFDQIISEANRMLEMVHGGRYRLYRTNEKGSGNKRGLELEVLDAREKNNRRPVSTLSGGEKFLVSLSLSIGMSAIAQKSGLHIEALFIDEGFGTLDESSIVDAMDILQHVQKSNGMIGVISHVSVLEGTISKHIEVVKTNHGSTLQVC